MKGLVRWLGEALMGTEPWETYFYWGPPPKAAEMQDQSELERRVRGYADQTRQAPDERRVEKQGGGRYSDTDNRQPHEYAWTRSHEESALGALRALEAATGTQSSVYLIRQVADDVPWERNRRPHHIRETDYAGLEESLAMAPRGAAFARYVVYAFDAEGAAWAERYFADAQAGGWTRSMKGDARRYERTWLVREERSPADRPRYATEALN